MKTMISGLTISVVLLIFGMVAADLTARDANAMMQRGHMMQGKGMMGGKGRGRMSMVRHRYVMRNGIDPAYADMSNPLEATDDVLDSGRRLYENNCMSCHGASGRGAARPDKRSIQNRRTLPHSAGNPWPAMSTFIGPLQKAASR